MQRLTWKLGTFLETHNIKPRQVENEAIRAGFNFGRNTIYRLLRGDGPDRYDKETLTALLVTLGKITGEPVSPNDLLEVTLEGSTTEPIRRTLEQKPFTFNALPSDLERDENPASIARAVSAWRTESRKEQTARTTKRATPKARTP